MLSSIAHVANVADWDPERILVWCDYCSVPQGHQGMQGFAINSIASYAACAAAFIVVAVLVVICVLVFAGCLCVIFFKIIFGYS